MRTLFVAQPPLAGAILTAAENPPAAAGELSAVP
jgi:hypothetical protein